MKHMSFIHSSIQLFDQDSLSSPSPCKVPWALGCARPPHATRTLHTPERLLEDLELPVLLFQQAGHVRHLSLEHTQLVVLLQDQGHVPLQFYLLLLVELS